jgi:hypothetical protein
MKFDSLILTEVQSGAGLAKCASRFRKMIEPCKMMSVAQRRAFAKANVKTLNALVALASSLRVPAKEQLHLFIIANDAIAALELLQAALKGSKPSDFVKLRYNLMILTVTSKQVGVWRVELRRSFVHNCIFQSQLFLLFIIYNCLLK